MGNYEQQFRRDNNFFLKYSHRRSTCPSLNFTSNSLKSKNIFMLRTLLPRRTIKPLLTARKFSKMALKTLGPKPAAELDKELMSEDGGFSIDQLMELAGLSVSQAVYKVHPPSEGKNVLIACGPGNNGGDGLVCARHLFHYGYTPQSTTQNRPTR